jgi:hypothetical protein
MNKILAATVCFAILLALAACNAPPAGTAPPAAQAGDDPTAVVEKFVQALKSDDYKGAWDLLSKESKEAFKENGQPSFEKFEKELKQEFGKDPEKKAELSGVVPQEVKITAVVIVKMKKGEEERTEEIPMVKEDGQWKIRGL